MTVEELDAMLLKRSLDGEPGAFRSLVVEHQSLVFSIAYYWCNDVEQAVELAVVSFRAAYRWLLLAPESPTVAIWLHDITDNICRMALRGELPVDDDYYSEGISGPDDDRSVDFTDPNCARLMIRKLSGEQQLVLILTHFEDLNRQQVADALGLEKENLDVLVAECFQSLIEIIADEMNGGGGSP